MFIDSFSIMFFCSGDVCSTIPKDFLDICFSRKKMYNSSITLIVQKSTCLVDILLECQTNKKLKIIHINDLFGKYIQINIYPKK